MKTQKIILLIISILLSAAGVAAKNDCSIILQCEPEGASVYLNGTLVCPATPAIIEVSSKMAKKPMMFQFFKDGYESKTITMSYTKKELKSTPVISCKLKPVQQKAYTDDPTIRKGEATKNVSRDKPGSTSLERSIVRWYFDSDPRGARIYYRVISSIPDQVKNTNETYLTTTPLEETRSFNILGLSYENSRDVTIEIKVTKRGYEDQIKRYNVRQALDQQEISGFFELVPKDLPKDSGDE